MNRFLAQTLVEFEKINPESYWQNLISGKIDGMVISFCSSRSSVTTYKDSRKVLSIEDLDYNSNWINSVSRSLDSNIESVGARFVFKKRISQITTCGRLLVGSTGQEKYFYYESSGISNKYHRLKIFRISV